MNKLKLFLIGGVILPLVLLAEYNVTITGTNTIAECRKTADGQYFDVFYWAEGCSFPTNQAQMNWLMSRSNYFTEPQACQLPSEPLLSQLGEHLNQESPKPEEDYIIIDENITNISTSYYPSFKDKNDNNVTTIYVNPRELGGYCRGLREYAHWRVDIYKGVVERSNFERTYQCIKPDGDFPELALNEVNLVEWKKGDENTAHLEPRCLEFGAEVQERVVDCQTQKRCVAEFYLIRCSRDEVTGSYVSPSSGIFSEDIPLVGTNLALHYQSSNLQNLQIAHG